MQLQRRILWIDALGGLGVGALVLGLHGPLSQLYGWTRGFTLFMGVVNLLYGLYSLSVARRATRPPAMIAILAWANMAWGLVCFALVWRLLEQSTVFGTGQLILEGLYVGGLGVLEWRWRGALTQANVAIQRSPGPGPG